MNLLPSLSLTLTLPDTYPQATMHNRPAFENISTLSHVGLCDYRSSQQTLIVACPVGHIALRETFSGHMR